MTESNDQSNSNQVAPRKQKSSIKDIFHNFFKPGIETQLHIKNMKLTDIPTQTTPVFIHIRQGREKIDTQAVKIADNTAVWQDEIIIDSRVPSIESQQRQQDSNNNSNNSCNSTNGNNNSAPQQTNTTTQRPSSMSNIHDYDNYDNYDNYDYEQHEENDTAPTSSNNGDQQCLSGPIASNSGSKNLERSEKRKEKKERRVLERKEKKEKKEKVKREKKENREKEKKEKKERKEKNSNSLFFCLEFTFRLEDVSGRSSTTYGKSILDLVQITTANDWEYRAVLHECNYESRFSCLISVRTKKAKVSNLNELPPPIPSLNSNSSSSNASNPNLSASNQIGGLIPPAKMPTYSSSRYENSHIYRSNYIRERSFTDRPKRIPIHESASLDGINEIISMNQIENKNNILLDNTDNEIYNDNFSFDDLNNSDAIPSNSSKRSKKVSSMKTSSIKNSSTNNMPKSHSHSKNHGHRKNDNAAKGTTSALCIPLDQNIGNSQGESGYEFDDKLPFKVQRDKLERLSDQVDDIINLVFSGASED